MNRNIIYMDNNATTKVDEEVALFMSENSNLYGNASSMHSLGRNAESGVSWARDMVANLIDGKASDIYFTFGATESNTFVFNTFKDLIDKGSDRKTIITSTIEHPSILDIAKYYENSGYKIVYAPVNDKGIIDLEKIEKLIDSDTLLVSIMLANNETGAIQPVKEIAKMARKAGSYIHTDATQAIGKIDVSVNDLDVDYLSLSAHKFYGPKGVGALYAKKGCPLHPLFFGHQENHLRAGTYNTIAILGMGKAAELAKNGVKEEASHLLKLKKRLKDGIEERIGCIVFNSEMENFLPGTLNVSFPLAEGESILLYLDMEGIEVSTGSACASGSLEPSYVLLAQGLDVEIAHGSVRFSLGKDNTEEDIDYVLEKLPPIISRIREISTRKEFHGRK